MDKIKKLEVKKLIKELNFNESDYLCKKEMINEIESLFIESVNLFLEDHPEVKKIFDEKINQKLESIFNAKKLEIENKINSEEIESQSEQKTEVIVDVKVKKLKKLYREIVKSTHPDIINNKKLNDIYLKATQYYNDQDLTGTYSICDDLEITYEIDEDDYQLIINRINELKERVKFIESTLSWQWYNTDSDNQKTKIIINYIKNRLND
jgi:hypothetical protein